jgi:hypothetical protein
MSKSKKTSDDHVLETLKKKPTNTYEFRKSGVFTPSGSVARLRQIGHEIETVNKSLVDDFGVRRYRVAEYHLKGADDE